MKKTIALILAVLLLCSGLLVGCSGNSSGDANSSPSATATESAGTPTESAEQVEIHYAYWAAPMDDFYAQCKADFEADHPNITIILEPTAWSEYWTKLETAATGGSVADVFHMNGVNITKYADGGVLLPLDDYIGASSLEMSNYPDAMNQLYTYDGVQYGIAMDYDTIGLWYNKALFDQAGVSYPTDTWTWDDLTAAAEAITGLGDGIYGIAAGYDDQGGFYNTSYALGGWFVDGDKLGFDDANTRAGIQCWVDLMQAGFSPSQASLTENAGYLQFMAGTLGMITAGDWFASYFSSADSKVADTCDVALMPLMDNGQRASVIHGKANCISASTEHPDEAWAWVEYLAGAEANQRLGETGIAIPSYMEYSSLFFDAYPQYNMSIFSQEAADCAYVYPSTAANAGWADIMWTELVKAYSLEITVDQACDNIMDQLGQ